MKQADGCVVRRTVATTCGASWASYFVLEASDGRVARRRWRGSLSKATPPLRPTVPMRGPFDAWQIRRIFGSARIKTSACSGPVRSAAVRTKARTRALTRACRSSSRRRICRSLVRTIHARLPTTGSQSASQVPAGNSDRASLTPTPFACRTVARWWPPKHSSMKNVDGRLRCCVELAADRLPDFFRRPVIVLREVLR